MDKKGDLWRTTFAKGRAFLSLHDPERALKCFESALEECPVARSHELGRILFFLGVTLQKLGMCGCALRSWGVATKLDKHYFSGKFLQRFSNCYGMVKQESEELDDYNAFYSIQMNKYLSVKRSGKIGNDAERDMISDLIREGWKEVKTTVNLAALDSCEKISAFTRHRIIFPTAFVPQYAREIPVNFAAKRKISYDDRCFCGSGLPYRLCCGRIPDSEKLVDGLF